MLQRVAPFLRRILGPLYIPARSAYMRATQPPISKSQAHDYWREPTAHDECNPPESYLEGSERSEFLAGILEQYAPHSASVLEIGCNVGRNLNCLLDHGYTKLTGVEINANALAMLRQSFPRLAATATLINSPLEEVAPRFRDGQFDVIYTMAVLMHIHPDSDEMFTHIARAASGHVITIEDETFGGGRCFARKYRTVFENLGMRQIAEFDCGKVPCLSETYVARVFTH